MALKRQIQDVDHWPSDKRRKALRMAFFLLSGPGSDPAPGVRVPKAAATCESEARLERVCGISRGSGFCTLLLYSPLNRG